MSLQTIGQIVKACVEADSTGIKTAWKIVDFVSHRIPLRMELFWGGFSWRVDGMAFCDERIEVDHLQMIVKRFDDSVS